MCIALHRPISSLCLREILFIGIYMERKRVSMGWRPISPDFVEFKKIAEVELVGHDIANPGENHGKDQDKKDDQEAQLRDGP